MYAEDAEGYNTFPSSAALDLLILQHKQSCISTNRLNIGEESDPVLLNCK